MRFPIMSKSKTRMVPFMQLLSCDYNLICVTGTFKDKTQCYHGPPLKLAKYFFFF